MDRRRRLAVVLRPAFAALALAACGAPAEEAARDAVAGFTAADAPELARRTAWLADGTVIADHVVRAPVECALVPVDPGARQAYEIGRAAFRSPLLLGGQAARLGISCETCHRGGHANPDFQLPAASGAPGTADVTDGFFSAARGDGVLNPVPIPDLADTESAKVDRAAPGELEAFLRGLVVEEFDGPAPPPKVLDGLAAYVRAQTHEACPKLASVDLDPERLFDGPARALVTAGALLADGDAETADAMLLYARTQLAPVAARLPEEGRGEARAAVVELSRKIETVRAALRDDDSVAARARYDQAASSVSLTLQAVIDAAPGSFFDPEVVNAALGERLGE